MYNEHLKQLRIYLFKVKCHQQQRQRQLGETTIRGYYILVLFLEIKGIPINYLLTGWLPDRIPDTKSWPICRAVQ